MSKMNIPNSKINQLNMELAVAINSPIMNISNEKLISRILLDKINKDNMSILYTKFVQLKTINDVACDLLKEAQKMELPEIKRQFLELIITINNMYLLNVKFRECLEGENCEMKLKNLIFNVVNIHNSEIIDTLMDKGYEKLVFNIFRKTTNDTIKTHIISMKDKFTDENIKYYLCN